MARRAVNAAGQPLESAFQGRVVGLLRVYGWRRIFHAPPGGHGRGAQRRVAGGQLPEGRGFPDLLAIHEELPRILVAEIKPDRKLAEPQRLRPGQLDWLQAFGRVGVAIADMDLGPAPTRPTVEAHLWTPDDWDQLHDVIRVGQPRRRDLDVTFAA